MSFTTTTMSVPPISVSEAARAAGWRDCDLRWESLQEEAFAAWRQGREAEAIRLWRRARRLAFWRFSRRDARYATSLANAGMAARLSGQKAAARRLYARALRVWDGVPAQISTLEPARRARSSLFHLRMEARHWETYRTNHLTRLTAFVAEARACLEALAVGGEPPYRLYERWRGEKPAVHDAPRKVLSAALLIAAPLTRG